MSIVNRPELAQILGVAPGTVDNMVKKGMPHLERPDKAAGTKEWRFDTATVIEWMVTGGKPDAMAEAELLDKRAQAGLRQLEFAERQKVLVRKDDSLRWVVEGIAIIKTRLLALPARLVQAVSAESDPAKNLVYIKAEVNDMLTAFSEHFAQRAAEVDAEPDEEPAEPVPEVDIPDAE